MAESVSYQLTYEPDNEFPVLSVVTARAFQAKGPLGFFTDFDGHAKWEMIHDGEVNRGPFCETVEEMLEKGWIEEIGD